MEQFNLFENSLLNFHITDENAENYNFDQNLNEDGLENCFNSLSIENSEKISDISKFSIIDNLENIESSNEPNYEYSNILNNNMNTLNVNNENIKKKGLKKMKKNPMDRFIPNRKTSKLHLLFTNAHSNNNTNVNKDKMQEEINETNKEEETINSIAELYKRKILNINTPNNINPKSEKFQNENYLRYNNIEYPQKSTNYFTMFNDGITSSPNSPSSILTRKIAKAPYKILDAPNLQDDFYLNLIDWSHTNLLAVALGQSVYLWSGVTNKVSKLCESSLNDPVTAVCWNPKGGNIAIGLNSGAIQIWDSTQHKKIKVYNNIHGMRVSSLAYNTNNILASGSRDKCIGILDLRARDDFFQKKLQEHKQEVCGLKWSFDEQQLASGGNDNKLLIWNLHSNIAIRKYTAHKAAVKALAWSPHQHGLLASGGGTADRTIRFWNTIQNSNIHTINTDSQVCNLIFSKNTNELVSTHGYSMNQIFLWNYPTLEKIATLNGHTSRVLYLSMSPDGESIVTGAGDETLRFWKICDSIKKAPKSKPYKPTSVLLGSEIR